MRLSNIITNYATKLYNCVGEYMSDKAEFNFETLACCKYIGIPTTDSINLGVRCKRPRGEFIDFKPNHDPLY